MKFILLLSILCLSPSRNVPSNICEIYGTVKIVESHAQYRVYITEDNDTDLFVKFVPAFANKPGKWQITTFDQDFSIQIVDNPGMADFRIRVSAFPGCNHPSDEEKKCYGAGL